MFFATTKEKILQFIDFKSISTTIFFKETGIKRGFLDSDKLKASVSDIFLAKIFAKYPELNLEWLITGNGEMLKTASFYSQKEPENSVNELENDYKSKDFLETEILFLKEKITMLEQERDFLKQIIKPSSEEKSNCA